MKVTDLGPCARCGGPVAPVLYRVTIQQHLIDQKSVREVLGLNEMLGGRVLPLAEAMSARGDRATVLVVEKSAVVCTECAFTADVLPWLFERNETDDRRTSKRPSQVWDHRKN